MPPLREIAGTSPAMTLNFFGETAWLATPTNPPAARR